MRTMTFTGTQEGMSQRQKDRLVELLLDYLPTRFRHGDCIGADAEAHALVRQYVPACRIIVHPADITKKRAWCKGDIILDTAPPLVRNHAMVDVAGIVVAAPATDTEILRSGTWSTVRYARRIGKRVHVMAR